MRASVFRAMKLTLRILAVLAVLAVSVAFGWKPASNAAVKRSSVTAVAGARTGGHRADGPLASRVRRHAASAGLYARAATSSRTATDDDDEYDDDIVESGFAASSDRRRRGTRAESRDGTPITGRHPFVEAPHGGHTSVR